MQAVLQLQKLETRQLDVSAFGSSCTSSTSSCCNDNQQQRPTGL
jgi:hypothetical protein